ncbi:MAG: M48 family metalloprotease [Candidatus Eisenbacteria bacterium]
MRVRPFGHSAPYVPSPVTSSLASLSGRGRPDRRSIRSARRVLPFPSSGWLVLLGAFLVLALCPGRAHAVDKDVAKAAERAFNEEPRAVRAGLEIAPITWIELDGSLYCYSVPRRLLRMGRQGSTFRIDSIKYERGHLELRMESTSGTRLDLRVFDSANDEEDDLSQVLVSIVLPTVLSTVFEFQSDASPDPITVNTESDLIHLTGCNHLPAPGSRRSFASLPAAEALGFVPCSICFTDAVAVDLPGYVTIRKEALENARLYEMAFPLVQDETVQSRVQETGESLLEALPFEGLGFDYRFRVVESSIANAISFPTGLVYVTSSLYRALESPRELEAVLAHEIAHCELHYNEDAENPESEAAAMRTTLTERYADRRRRETESDVAAAALLVLAHPGDDPLYPIQRVLRKLQYASYEVPTDEAQWNSTHATTSERLSLFHPTAFEALPPDRRYLGVNEAGETLVEVVPVAITHRHVDTASTWTSARYRDTSLVVLFVHLGEAAEPENKVEGQAVRESGTRVAWGSAKYLSALEPGRSGIQVAPFVSNIERGDITDFELKFEGVEEWQTEEVGP